MAEFLPTSKHIASRVEDVITNAKETVFLVSPNFSHFSKSLFTKVWEALGRSVKVVLIYREITGIEESEIVFLQKRSISMFHNPRVNTNAYFNEKEAVLTSSTSFAGADENKIEFGVYFRKTYAAEMYADLLKECRLAQRDGTKMVLDDGKFVSYDEVLARKPKPPEPTAAEVLMVSSSKKLTVKEKQKFIVQLFSRECQECTLKVEDAERLRIMGKGMVLALSKERVDVIFVHYGVYQTKIEEVKEFITSRHPDLKAWFQYNRINLNLESENDITSVFPTLKQAVSSFELI